LVGSNGAGKTSTLRAIMGLRSPSKGEIRLARGAGPHSSTAPF
jgi:ABC-type multidrug transport system ATPase subunit